MNPPTEVTPIIKSGRAADGSRVFVGYLEELPGVTCQASSAKEALSDLISAVSMFQERLGWPIVAVKSEAVGSWTWTMATGGESGPPVVYHGLDGPRTGPVPGELPQVEVPQPWTLRTA